MTPDKQAAPSEWVELGVELADEAARWAYKAGDHGNSALLERRDAELAALRAHLECQEREHLATKALVRQLAEALEELHYAHTDKADAMTRAALAAYQEKT